jgi:hypothetical protein
MATPKTTVPPAVPRGKLRPETPQQRVRFSKVTAADEDEMRARIEALSEPGRIVDKTGQLIQVSSKRTRAMLLGEA